MSLSFVRRERSVEKNWAMENVKDRITMDSLLPQVVI